MQKEGKETLVKGEHGAKNFGVTLIALGVVSLVVACIQYWQLDKKLHFGRKWYTNLTFVSAGLIGLLGLVSLVNLIFKIGPF